MRCEKLKNRGILFLHLKSTERARTAFDILPLRTNGYLAITGPPDYCSLLDRLLNVKIFSVGALLGFGQG